MVLLSCGVLRTSALKCAGYLKRKRARCLVRRASCASRCRVSSASFDAAARAAKVQCWKFVGMSVIVARSITQGLGVSLFKSHKSRDAHLPTRNTAKEEKDGGREQKCDGQPTSFLLTALVISKMEKC